jgi:hypothetical protein
MGILSASQQPDDPNRRVVEAQLADEARQAPGAL